MAGRKLNIDTAVVFCLAWMNRKHMTTESKIDARVLWRFILIITVKNVHTPSLDNRAFMLGLMSLPGETTRI